MYTHNDTEVLCKQLSQKAPEKSVWSKLRMFILEIDQTTKYGKK